MKTTFHSEATGLIENKLMAHGRQMQVCVPSDWLDMNWTKSQMYMASVLELWPQYIATLSLVWNWLVSCYIKRNFASA